MHSSMYSEDIYFSPMPADIVQGHCSFWLARWTHLKGGGYCLWVEIPYTPAFTSEKAIGSFQKEDVPGMWQY